MKNLIQVTILLQVQGITSGRFASLLPILLGLLSILLVVIAKKGSMNAMLSKQNKSILAIVLGFIAIILSVRHLANSFSAELGTGSGKAGAVVALVLGLTGILLGILALKKIKGNT